jgi:hypothetical protein
MFVDPRPSAQRAGIQGRGPVGGSPGVRRQFGQRRIVHNQSLSRVPECHSPAARAIAAAIEAAVASPQAEAGSPGSGVVDSAGDAAAAHAKRNAEAAKWRREQVCAPRTAVASTAIGL